MTSVEVKVKWQPRKTYGASCVLILVIIIIMGMRRMQTLPATIHKASKRDSKSEREREKERERGRGGVGG